jgi:ATP:corrinoid adenosyltransferase
LARRIILILRIAENLNSKTTSAIGLALRTCRGRVELVVTGRNAPTGIIELADYVTEFVQIKHPYYCGVRPRRGIEY